MARVKEEESVGYTSVVELTNSTTTDISFQVIQGEVEIIVVLDGVSVTSAMKGWRYSAPFGETNKPLVDLDNTISTVGRVYARGVEAGGSVVRVDHA